MYAKKFEIRRDEMKDAGKKLGIEDMRDMDYESLQESWLFGLKKQEWTLKL